MKKLISLFLLSILTAVTTETIAQTSYPVNHFKDPVKVETDEYTIEFFDILCQKEYAKGRMKITNKTNDFLVYDQGKTRGVFSFGAVDNEKGKEIYIDPYKSASRTFTFTGENMHVEQFSIEVGGISRLPINGVEQTGEPFLIPNRSNEITLGSFHCQFDKMTKKTDKLSISFKCQYNGNKIGIVDPSKSSFVYPNNNEYANAESKSSAEVLEKGDSKKFSFSCSEHKKDGDLQFIEMKLNWKNSFSESEKKPLGSIKVECEYDLAKTMGKNK